jgi:DNA-directed RNA polymerase specialized sigma24 family protein
MSDKPLARMSVACTDRGGGGEQSLSSELVPSTDTPWHEDAARVRAGLRWGREKERLLDWVRGQMLLRLTRVERRCVELYYFEDLNYRCAAARLGVNATSVYRAVQRGVRKLREAARAHPPRAVRRSSVRRRTWRGP